MDINMSGQLFRRSETLMNYASDHNMNDNFGDTALSLDCLGYGSKSIKEKYSQSSADLSPEDDSCQLVLGLGPTPTSYCADHPARFDKTEDSANLLNQRSISRADSRMLELGLSRGNAEPITATSQENRLFETTYERSPSIPAIDEGSSSAKRSGGYMPSLLLAPRVENIRISKGRSDTQDLVDVGSDASTLSPHHFRHRLRFSPEPSATTNSSMCAVSDNTVAGTSADQRMHYHHHPKKCRFKGCAKGARGASGLCIAHGGGQRCQKPGCNKGAESRTAYCKAHGGGRRCQQLGCTKSAEGKTEFCIAHGGGRRCGNSGCNKAARGKSGLCIRHGGGKRCTVEGCARSAEGQAGLCISHGGGRRCQYAGCDKGAQGSTLHCKAHGGGKRCIFEGCTKGAEGSTPLCKGHGGGKRCLFEGGGVCPKSVHGGTDYCVAHGGGKRCAVPGCTKSARGRTDCCVRHGGGKRCRFEGCGKSAQGSTDFCKAHGGGKRCSWALGCEKFARGKSGLCAAHGSMLSQQGRDAGKGSNMIGPGLFRGIVSASARAAISTENEHSSGVSAISDCTDSQEGMGGRHLLIPHQVLVPLSMKSPSVSSGQMGGGGESLNNGDFRFVIPEGRVHGGGLMSFLGGNLKNALDARII